MKSKENLDPFVLLKKDFEAIEMKVEFERELMNRTGNIVSSGRRRPVWKWAAALAGAAVLIILAVLLWKPNGGAFKDGFYFTAVDKAEIGFLVIESKLLKEKNGNLLNAGDVVQIGSALETDKTGGAKLITRGGSQIYMDSDTEIVFSSEKVARISRGRILCKNSQKEIEQIDTPAGRIKLLGTVVDTNVISDEEVEVAVLEGSVELSNAQGRTVVEAGKKAVMMASNSPGPGSSFDEKLEGAWYREKEGTGYEPGDIAYMVRRNDNISELWIMKPDGSGKRRVKSFVGGGLYAIPRDPGGRWIDIGSRWQYWVSPRDRRPIILMDLETGNTTLYDLPEGLRMNLSFSSDPFLVAFCGFKEIDDGLPDRKEFGLWILNLKTQKLRKMYTGYYTGFPSWSSDNKRILFTSRKELKGKYNITILDVDTGKIEELGIDGHSACFSPDGKKIAYVGQSESVSPTSKKVTKVDSVYVYDLTKKQKPIMVSLKEQRGRKPKWSPDGTLIMLEASLQRIYIVGADGSGLKYSFRPKSRNAHIWNTYWGADGKGIFVNLSQDGVGHTVPVSLDGPDIIVEVDVFSRESVISDEAQKDADKADEAVKKAHQLFETAKEHEMAGNLSDMRYCLKKSADIFTLLAWDYPLVDLDPDSTIRHADEATRLRNMSDDEILESVCDRRIRSLSYKVERVHSEYNGFPKDIAEALSYAKKDADSSFKEKIKLLDKCPGTGDKEPAAYIYEGAAGSGDVVIKCPLHPDNCYKWDGEWFVKKK